MKSFTSAVVGLALLIAGCGQGRQISAAAAPPPVATAAAVSPEPPALPEPAPAPAPQPPQGPQHVDVRGLYMTGWTAGIDDWFYGVVDWMLQAGLNAMVIDAKDDDGRLSWPMDIPLAQETGANDTVKVRDIRQRLAYLHERGIYTIARVVVFADPHLGSRRPEMAILKGQWRDTRGIAWPDPYNRAVWEYNVAVAKEAAKAGFKEIQFDYIRFPEHRLQGYNAGVPVQQRTDAVEGFLRYAVQELRPLGVFVSADIFGLTTSVAPGDDMEIGQDYAAIAAIVDYVQPMIYPSHFARGTYGIADPNAQPGEVVYQAMVRAQQRTWSMDPRKHRPWIQDFNLGKTYTARDVEEQIEGLARAGIHQYLLWDPNVRYSRSANHRLALPTGEEPAWKAEYRRRLQELPVPPE